jgi:hypothetical protein
VLGDGLRCGPACVDEFRYLRATIIMESINAKAAEQEGADISSRLSGCNQAYVSVVGARKVPEAPYILVDSRGVHKSM